MQGNLNAKNRIAPGLTLLQYDRDAEGMFLESGVSESSAGPTGRLPKAREIFSYSSQ